MESQKNPLVNGSQDAPSGIDTRKKPERNKGNATVTAGRWGTHNNYGTTNKGNQNPGIAAGVAQPQRKIEAE